MAWRCGGECADLDVYILDQALSDASFLVNAWTAFAYSGPCEATARPVAQYGPSHGYPEWVPPVGAYSWGMWPFGYSGGAFWGGPWGFGGWGFCSGGCGGSPLARSGCDGGPSQVALGAYPLRSISSVVIDGVLVDPAEYRVDDERWLVRVPTGDNEFAHWPCCQNLALPSGVGDTTGHTWEVSFVYGATVPDAGIRAVIAYACQIAKDRCNGTCTVPAGVTQVNREGVSLTLVRPTDDILDGLPSETRAFINAANPAGLRHRPRVYSPDLPREVVTTTWP